MRNFCEGCGLSFILVERAPSVARGDGTRPPELCSRCAKTPRERVAELPLGWLSRAAASAPVPEQLEEGDKT